MKPNTTKDLIRVLDRIKDAEIEEMDQGSEINSDGYLNCCGNQDFVVDVGQVDHVAQTALFRPDGTIKTGVRDAMRRAGYPIQEQHDPEDPGMNYVAITIPGDDEDRTLTVSTPFN